MKRKLIRTIPMVWIAACILTACEQSEPKKTAEGNPLLKDIKAEVAQFRGFKYRQFSSISGWTIWYFQTDLGFKCVGSKSTNGNPRPVPEAVFERKSIGDIRMDMWITSFDDIPVVRVPNFGEDLTAATAGYFRSQADEFMKPITFEGIKDLTGEIEIQPNEAIGDPKRQYKLNLSGFPAAVKSLLECEKSGPKS